MPVIPAPVAITSKVAEAANYELVYELDIATQNDFTSTVPYTVDNAAAYTPGSFLRIAYFLELDGEWVWTSMDAFESNAALIGVPSTTAHFHQGPVGNLNVAASPGSGVTDRTGSSTGNIEFWPSSYSQGNTVGVPNANAGTFDFGDEGGNTSDGHGSFQIHNHDLDLLD